MEPNVLLTLAQDFVVRIWQESCSTERLQFGVCAVIEPRQECMVGWITNPLEIYQGTNDCIQQQLHVYERQSLRHSLLPSSTISQISFVLACID